MSAPYSRYALLLVATALLSACGSHSHAPHDAHAEEAQEEGHHDHELPVAQVTIWSPRYEIFTEYEPPVAGKAVTLITHLSDLRTRQAANAGAVTFILRSGETVLQHPEAGPARSGIYLPSLTFPHAGDWTVSMRGVEDGEPFDLRIADLTVFASHHDAEHAVVPEAPEGLSFLKEQQWKIRCATTTAVSQALVERVRVTAQVRARPGSQATVTIPMPGHVRPPSDGRIPLPGERVEAGQLLAILQPTFSDVSARWAEAEAGRAAARATLDEASRAHDRIVKLAQVQAKSEREVQESARELAMARARYEAADALVGSLRGTNAVPTASGAPLAIELRSPIAGYVQDIQAGAGVWVDASSALLTVLDPSLVWLEARIPESQVSRLVPGTGALIERLDARGSFQPVGGEGRGRLLSLGMEVDRESGTVPLRYEVDNASGQLRVGQSVLLHVETARRHEALCLPDAALLEEGEQLIAYVQVSGETFAKREVRTGLRSGGWVEVLEGVSPGERVVTDGAFAIRLSSMTGAIPEHGHVH